MPGEPGNQRAAGAVDLGTLDHRYQFSRDLCGPGLVERVSVMALHESPPLGSLLARISREDLAQAINAGWSIGRMCMKFDCTKDGLKRLMDHYGLWNESENGRWQPRLPEHAIAPALTLKTLAQNIKARISTAELAQHFGVIEDEIKRLTRAWKLDATFSEDPIDRDKQPVPPEPAEQASEPEPERGEKKMFNPPNPDPTKEQLQAAIAEGKSFFRMWRDFRIGPKKLEKLFKQYGFPIPKGRAPASGTKTSSENRAQSPAIEPVAPEAQPASRPISTPQERPAGIKIAATTVTTSAQAARSILEMALAAVEKFGDDSKWSLYLDLQKGG